MRSSWTTQFGQGPHVSTRKIAHPVIVTEQHADPVDSFISPSVVSTQSSADAY